MSLPPSEIPQGAIRFNTDSQKLEFYAQGEWWVMSTDTPNLASAGDSTPGARGLFGGGATNISSDDVDTIDYINIASTGNAIDFGNLTDARDFVHAASSATRGVFFGGTDPGVVGAGEIDYVTISSTGNAVDWGINQTTAQRNAGAIGNQTRGIYGGTDGSNVIEYITFATTGTRNDFGDLIVSCQGNSATNSPVRGVFMGAYSGVGTNIIQFITIATTGNSQDFGDLIQARAQSSAGTVSNGVRGLVGGGITPTYLNSIEYINIATTGNAMNFGDLSNTVRIPGSTSSATRGVFAGGDSPTYINTIEYIIISTEGDAVDFGDLTQARHGSAGVSNAHGGL